MAGERACKTCHIIVQENVQQCPVCKSTNLSRNFSGLVIIIDPEDSEVAKRLHIRRPGTYAIRVR
ncbi:MAG: transcription elongation factor subunit Spt4 [Candidatus Hodarchaeota archaeon]